MQQLTYDIEPDLDGIRRLRRLGIFEEAAFSGKSEKFRLRKKPRNPTETKPKLDNTSSTGQLFDHA